MGIKIVNVGSETSFYDIIYLGYRQLPRESDNSPMFYFICCGENHHINSIA